MDRIILHCDCNCFYASCELLSHPDLRQLPVAVCGDPTERHGIILAKNEPAKRCGVKTAETIWKAKQKCPGLILLPPHHRLYAEYSKKINAVYGEYTDLVEPFGIDESWLDITGSMHLFGGDPKAMLASLDRLAALPSMELEAYLTVVVERKCIDLLRQQSRLSGSPFDETIPLVTPVPCGDALADAMGRLPPRYREALLLRHACGYSTRETAALLELSFAAAQKLLYRAREALRTELEREAICP